MAVARKNPKCSDCGETIKALTVDKGKDFIGDTFFKWDFEGHRCNPLKKLFKKKKDA